MSTAPKKKAGTKASAKVKRTKKEPAVACAKCFCKWAGGKTQILHELEKRLPERFVGYHEPFVGGGALFWRLAELKRLRRGQVALADMLGALVRTWRVIRDDVDGVVSRLARYPITKDHYLKTRALDPAAIKDDAEVAAWFIFLNKTGYNGMYRVNREGGFNIPWGRWEEQKRSPTVLDEANLRACSAVLGALRVAVNQRPFEDVRNYVRPGDLVYLDPPYLPRSETADFVSYTKDGFDFEDHKRLRDVARELKERGVHILLSNSDTPLVRDLYESWPGFEIGAIQARRAINSDGEKRGPVGEIIVT